jgi:hypothetical protein
MVIITRSISLVRSVALALATLIAAVVAVPSALASTWAPHSLVFPSGVTQEQLFGVSCASSSTCLAVGEDYKGNWGIHAEAGSGSTWTFQSGLTRISGSVLFGASCPSTSWCASVGYKSTSGGEEAMAQLKSGSTWTYNNVGVPAGATRSSLNGISCSSSSWCMGVGWKMVSGDDKPFAAGFNGSTWTHLSAPTASNATLLGVSCASSSSCVAVGASAGTALAQVWNGFSWSTTPAVAVPAGGSQYALRGVSCVSATWCLATGTYTNSSGLDRPFAAVWNGSTWTTTPAIPWGGNIEAEAYGVSCVATTECWVVGEGHYGSTVSPWGVLWTGTTWAIGSLPMAAGAGGATLRSVSCTATGRCEAAGWSLFGGTPTGLIETLS